jgi:hypothetical protein
VVPQEVKQEDLKLWARFSLSLSLSLSPKRKNDKKEYIFPLILVFVTVGTVKVFCSKRTK